jgi:hypothetical protein
MGQIPTDWAGATDQWPEDAVDFDRRLALNRRSARIKRTAGSGPQTAIRMALRFQNVPDRVAVPEHCSSAIDS